VSTRGTSTAVAIQHEKSSRGKNEKRASTDNHKAPKCARLASRVPFDTLQAVVSPEMAQEKGQKLTSSMSTCVRSREKWRGVRGRRELPRRERRSRNHYSWSPCGQLRMGEWQPLCNCRRKPNQGVLRGEGKKGEEEGTVFKFFGYESV